MRRLGFALLAAGRLTAVAFAQVGSPALIRIFASPGYESFSCPQGRFPVSPIEGSEGKFYGAAAGGGSGMNAQGTIFKVTPAGRP
jgi:hypothetical protein